MSGEVFSLMKGSPAPGENLLDNWYFPNPVNQRGVSGTISAAGYFIDRWYLVSGSVTITSEGLVLTGTMEQRFETAFPGILTASVLSTTGLDGAAAAYDAANKKLTVTAAGQTLTAVKLELGETQTLAHKDADGNWVLNDPPPNYARELAKCQRYQVVLNNVIYCAGVVSYGDATNAQFFAPLPVTPRSGGTITGTATGTQVIANGTSKIATAWGGNGGLIPAANGVRGSVTIPTGYNQLQNVTVQLPAGVVLDFNL